MLNSSLVSILQLTEPHRPRLLFQRQGKVDRIAHRRRLAWQAFRAATDPATKERAWCWLLAWDWRYQSLFAEVRHAR